MKFEFFLPLQIEPKQGDRSCLLRAKSGKQFVHHYRAAAVQRNMNALAILAAPYRPVRPLEGPVRATFCFQFPFLASHSKRFRASMQPKDTKPDLENLCKNLNDVLEASGFFHNDAQVAELTISKCWTDSPGVHVRLETIDPVHPIQ
jgi:Holliday junction resolvase RusA-like endonuclease